MRRHLLPIVLVSMALASCSSSDDEPSGSGAGSTTSSSSVGSSTTDGGPTATARPADPFAIPEVIDAEYLNRVLAELYRINGDVLRKVLASDSLDISDLAPLRAIYNDPQYETQAKGVLDAVQSRGEFLAPPGDRRTTVKKLHSADPTCIVAEVTTDFSAVVRDPSPLPSNQAELIVLAPTQQGADSMNTNPTPLSIVDAEVLPTGQLPDGPCA